MAEMQSHSHHYFLRRRPPSLFSGIKTNSILFDAARPARAARPPRSRPSYALRGRSPLALSHELNSTYLFSRRGVLAPSSDVVVVAVPQPSAAATYHKEVVGLPLPSSFPLPPSFFPPSFDYLSVARFSAVIG